MDDLKQALNIFEFVKFCKPQSVEFLKNLHTAYNYFLFTNKRTRPQKVCYRQLIFKCKA